MITTIQKWGNSSAVRLPKAVMQALRLQIDDKVEIVPQGNSILITPAKPKRLTLEEIFAGWDGEHADVYDWGELDAPVGREIL